MNFKQIYLDFLKDGPVMHHLIFSRMKARFDCDPTKIRNELLSSGHIREAGCKKRKDGKNMYSYELTGKKLVVQKEKPYSNTWEDGTLKSRGNAFDWRNNRASIFKKNELAAIESGRKLGINGNNQVNVYSRAGV